MIHPGDCVEVMATMESASVDAIVTDPPYMLQFMGKTWDSPTRMSGHRDETLPELHGGTAHDHGFAGHWKPGLMQEWHQAWATEAFRVAKPGAYLLAFGGTRTYHRMVCAIEDAGWIIRDCLVWAYASGFPKSRALLKPAWEPIVMARKPGPLRELAIDACRIPSEGHLQWERPRNMGYGGGTNAGNVAAETNTLGRWPANVILTDPIFDGDTAGVVGGGIVASGWTNGDRPSGARGIADSFGAADVTGPHYGDSGTYSRFFLIPKEDRSGREPILTPWCNCQTDKLPGWSSEPLPRRDTYGDTSAGASEWSTTTFGNAPTGRSRRASRSTTSTETKPTTGSTTSELWTPLPTSASTPDVSSEMANGGSAATDAEPGDPSPATGSTSTERAGLPTDDVRRATSGSSSKRSVCERCGKEVPQSGSRFNAHPT